MNQSRQSRTSMFGEIKNKIVNSFRFEKETPTPGVETKGRGTLPIGEVTIASEIRIN